MCHSDAIEKYLHVLLDVDAEFDREAPIDWSEKIERVEYNCR